MSGNGSGPPSPRSGQVGPPAPGPHAGEPPGEPPDDTPAAPPPLRSRARQLVIVGTMICLAAFNSGNNIFFLVAATLFATVIVSKWKGWRLVRAVDLQGFASSEGIFANRPGSLLLRAASRRGTMALHLSHPQLPATVPAVATPDGASSTVPVLPSRRGTWHVDGLRLGSVAPYGITLQGRTLRLSNSVVVFPEPAPGVDLASLLSRCRSNGHTLTAQTAGSGTDFLSLREYHPEDGIRRIHWRGLAKTGELLSKVYEEEEQRLLTLYLDRGIPEDTPEWRGRFEEAVSRITAAILQAHERGRSFALSMQGHPTLMGRGLRHRNATLGVLAQVVPLVGDAGPRVPAGEEPMLFTARPS